MTEKFKQLTLLTLSVLSIPLMLLITMPKASAQVSSTLHASCQDGTYQGNLGVWNWPKFVQLNGGGDNRNSGSTYLPNFDKENSSYFIYRIPSQQTLYDNATLAGSPSTYDGWTNYSWNQYTMIVSTDNAKRLAMYETTTTTQFVANNPAEMRKYTIIDGTANNQTNVFGGSALLTTPQSINTVAVSCALVAHNVDYQASWTYTQITKNITAGDEVQCDTWDVACKIAGAFRGIADTFKTVGEVIVKALASFFMPDGTKVKSYIDDFNTFMSDKLGFLVYPVTFMADFFGAFTDTSNNWCTSAGCTKSFGNIFGSNFSLNFTEMNIHMPSMFTWFLAALRGMTVLMLIFMVRHKFMEVQAK